jgi:hypothetical protein
MLTPPGLRGSPMSATPEDNFTVGIIYEHAEHVRLVVREIDHTLSVLGYKVEVDYKHQDEIDSIGWLHVLNLTIYRCDVILFILSDELHREWDSRHCPTLRGLREELALVGMLKKPIVRIIAEHIVELSPSEFRDFTNELFEYLRALPARWPEVRGNDSETA